MTDLKQLALDCGFTAVGDLDVSTLEFLPEVREMCAADRCRSYGRSWACPPACGSLEHWRDAAARYSRGLILQTVGDREDSYDFEAMMAVEKQNSANFARLVDALAAEGLDALPMSAGTCTRCAKCTYPDAPCRFPEKVFPSMEACGLFVSKVCRDNGMPYYYGDDKIAYTCCVLY